MFWPLNENKLRPRIFYPGKLSFKIDGAIKIFPNKHKLKKNMATKPPIQKILQEILHTEDESKQNERNGSIKPQEKKRQIIRE
jgi:hypothetical protein